MINVTKTFISENVSNIMLLMYIRRNKQDLQQNLSKVETYRKINHALMSLVLQNCRKE